MLGGVYLFVVFVIITVEVTSGSTSLLGWAFLICSVAYGLGVILICFTDIDRKHIAFVCVVVAIPLGWLAAIVVGVNFKLLIGGHL